MAEVRLEKIGKAYGQTRVLSGLDLDVKDGEFLVLVGPSGCGKSTALRIIAGLDEPTEGTISIGGRVVNGVPPRERDIAMVFQSYALYPHMTVRANLSFGLEMRKVPRVEADARLHDAAEFLGLSPFLDRTPRQLSGGQRQRVALGRALVRRPALFLFDEPLSNLDAALRVQMRAELARLQERYATTSIYVTHDQVEAMTLGHRIAILNDGVLQQVGPPLDVYRDPANLFVAGFLGTPPINRLQARVERGGAALVGDGFVLPMPPALRAITAGKDGLQVVVGIRPEHLHEEPGPGRAPLDVRVGMVEPLGHEVIVHGRVGASPGAAVAARVAPARPPEPGAPLVLHADVDALQLFDANTGLRFAA
ncbi:MAG TPA: sn-glycerol-3-phosphate ABC transporter ATP-binding protein UgpC [Thermoanaerobaculia bacterium]